MNSDVTKRTLKELDELSVRYASFLDRFRDIALEPKDGRILLRLSPKTDARGTNRLYPIFPPEFYDKGW